MRAVVAPSREPAGNREVDPELAALHAEAMRCCAAEGIYVRRGRALDLVRQFRDTGHTDAQSFPAWVFKRGDVVVCRPKPRASDPRLDGRRNL